MSLFSTLITSMCISSSTMTRDACSKAIDAGGKQSGVEQKMNDLESKETQSLDKDLKASLGDAGFNVVGGTVFAAKTVRDKSLSFGLPNFGICDSVKTELKPESYKLKLEWNF
jgi:hypothetical protein